MTVLKQRGLRKLTVCDAPSEVVYGWVSPRRRLHKAEVHYTGDGQRAITSEEECKYM
jgi:hypothetical protein